MTELLRKVVATVEALPPEQQDFYAQVLLDELASERRWDELFSRPIEGTKLEALIEEAGQEIRQGRTMPLEDFLARGRPPGDGAGMPRAQQPPAREPETPGASGSSR